MVEGGACEYCRKLAERVAALEAAIQAREAAREREQQQSDRRFHEANEVRASLSDLSKLMLPRIEYSTSHQAMIDRMGSISERIDRMEGSVRFASWGIGVLVTGILGWLTLVHKGTP